MAQAIGAYRAAIDGLRRSKQTPNLTTEALWLLIGTGFSLEQLHRDLDDLGERIEESSRRK